MPEPPARMMPFKFYHSLSTSCCLYYCGPVPFLGGTAFLCHCEPVRRLVWSRKGIFFGHNPQPFRTPKERSPLPSPAGEGAAAAAGVEGTRDDIRTIPIDVSVPLHHPSRPCVRRAVQRNYWNYVISFTIGLFPPRRKSFFYRPLRDSLWVPIPIFGVYPNSTSF